MFGKTKFDDPFDTRGTASPPSRPARAGSARHRTPGDNSRYDEITRKVIRNQRVDPRDFRSEVDYLAWCDRVEGAAKGDRVITDERGRTAMPFTGRHYDAVRKLRG
jgi:hypothetical protein